jgi:hypothetical protein
MFYVYFTRVAPQRANKLVAVRGLGVFVFLGDYDASLEFRLPIRYEVSVKAKYINFGI